MASTVPLTHQQAVNISTFVITNRVPGAGATVEVWPTLEKEFGVSTAQQAQGIAAQALRDTGHSDSEISSLLQLPHGASVAELIDQALIGLGLAAGLGSIGAGAGTATDAGSAGATAGETGAAAGTAASVGASTAAKLGTSGLLAGLGSLSDWQQLAIRALEALAGAALILLGLQALTGSGSGNPVDAVASVRKVVR